MSIWRGTVVLVALVLAPIAGLAAKDDVRGAKDHPLLTRFPDSRITEYKNNFDAVEFAVGAGADGSPKRQRVEGNATFIRYFHASTDKQPGPLELIRNYQNAIKGINGTIAYERLPRDTDGGETTLKVNTGGKDIWVRVEPDIFSAPTQSYTLHIVEVAAMQQVVSANKMLEELNKQGFIALYINFDTGKWDLKSDGQATVREIVAMLKAAPALRIAVEGHTDNVGNAASNKTLSENRARSVANAIAAGGIDAKRLTAAGFGQERPVADNRSEEGRAKNRRVELVKQ
jgi:outer membrane protein OmpA-like peptidoglycan-associated protein